MNRRKGSMQFSNCLILYLIVVSLLANSFSSHSFFENFETADVKEEEVITRIFYSTASDGYLRHNGPDYTDIRNASTASTIYDDLDYVRIGQRYMIGQYFISRAYLYFNTSVISQTAIILSAKLGLYGYGAYITDPTPDFNITIQNGQPTYPHDPLIEDDYNMSLYTGNGGQFNTTSWSTSSYNNISLTETALSWINVTGITKLCLRSSRDIDGVAPTDRNEYVDFYSNEGGNGGYRPFLEVTYRIDPTASTTERQLRDPFQRKTFYYGGRVWVMFNNSTDGHVVLTSSKDGKNWEKSIHIGSLHTYMGEYSSLFFDGTYVHFVWVDVSSYDLCYRRGKPYGNGTIDLDSPCVVYDGTPDDWFIMPNICVDSEGYPWVGACWSGTVSPYAQARVFKSSLKNGSWQTADGFPHCLNKTNSIFSTARTVFVKLLNGKMGVLYQKMNDFVWFDLWNGTVWTITEEQASLQKSVHGDFLTAVSILDDMHMCYLAKDEPYNVIYRKRNSTAWEATETIIVEDADGFQGAVMNWAKSDDSLCVFWSNKPEKNHLYYRRRYLNGTWGGVVDWFTSNETLTNSRTLHVSYETAPGENITVIYQVGTSPPYHFRYNYIALPAQNIAVTNVTLSKTVVGQGYCVNVTVTIENQGDYVETFNVTTYANIMVINKTEITLLGLSSINFTFAWNTTGFVKGDYVINATATSVPYETDLEDNTFLDGVVLVTIPGDVNGDRKVNMRDLYSCLILNFECEMCDPCYVANYDINGDGKINIWDIYRTVLHFGQEW